MSDIEEPPTKVAKYEMSQTFTQFEELEDTNEEIEEGQEEWLSEEGLLTDDDTAPDQDQSTTSQLQDTTTDSQDAPTTRETDAKIDANIERTLNSMDNSQSSQTNDAFDELLKQDPNGKKDESDENDTDDLLRLLEDDGKSKKVKVMTKTKSKDPAAHNASSDDDDGFIYQGTTVKKVKLAKNALIHRYPATKAMPETTDDDETDASLDDVNTMQKMFAIKKPANSHAAAAKPAQKPVVQPLKKSFVPKQVVRIGNSNTFRQAIEKRAGASSTPLPRSATKSLLRPELAKPKPAVKPSKPEIKKSQPEHDEIIKEDEFLEEDGIDLDEDFAAESDSDLGRRSKQRIMKPERMDEDMPSDEESHSEDDSMYDELPSSDSDDMDDWFTLDIRAERAGDYLPLLGPKAYELLTQEKMRVSSRLDSLRQSLQSLNTGSRQQTEKLKAASQTLAEIDDMLKAH